MGRKVAPSLDVALTMVSGVGAVHMAGFSGLLDWFKIKCLAKFSFSLPGST